MMIQLFFDLSGYALKRINPALISSCVMVLVIACGGVGSKSTTNDNSQEFQNKDSGYLVPSNPSPVEDGVTLSGTLQVGANLACDWDVNDPGAVQRSNSQPETAQPLTVPVKVGGFIGAGADGVFNLSNPDSEDYYAATLVAGDTIRLASVDTLAAGTLELEVLAAADQSPVVAAAPVQEGDSIQIPGNADYLIHISAQGGAFNYVLDIGDALGTAQVDKLSARAVKGDFVAGEAIVRFKNGASGSDPFNSVNSDNRLGVRAFALDNRLMAVDHSEDRPALMQFKSSEQKALLRKQLKLAGSGANPSLNSLSASGQSDLQDRMETLEIISALNRQPDVLYAEPNYYRRVQYVPDDQFYPWQWNFPLIGMESAWDILLPMPEGDPVVVAVVDSGVLFGHRDLRGRFTSDGYDFISDPVRSLDGDGVDPDFSDPGDNPNGGSSFHGSHVTGIIAANTGDAYGVAGLAGPGNRVLVMPLRSIGLNGLGTVEDTLEALRYAAGMENTSGTLPSKPADVINLSLGGDQYSQAEAELYSEIIAERNIVVVAAAGNDSSNHPLYPASYPGVISVSAVDPNRQLAFYSNFGANIDVAAPGGDLTQNNDGNIYGDGIVSAVADDSNNSSFNTWAFYHGTSMAAPHVSGVVALMKAIRPQLTVADVLGWLSQGELTSDLGESGWDQAYGYGLIDAPRALVTARDLTSPPADFLLGPDRIVFSSTQSEAEVKLAKLGVDPLAPVETITPSVPWITVDAVSVDSEGMGTYVIRVNRTHPDITGQGIYEAQVDFSSSQRTSTLTISLQVGDVGEEFTGNNDIGRMYVLLLDADDSTTRYYVPAEYLENGQYQFEFSGVAPGRYLLVAGSNRDNDDRIGEPGEAVNLTDINLDLNQTSHLSAPLTVGFNIQ